MGININNLNAILKGFDFHFSEDTIRQYMRQKGILQVEFNHENNTVLTLDLVQDGEQQFLTETFVDIQSFLESVEKWLRNQN